jgi:hypothetical protein
LNVPQREIGKGGMPLDFKLKIHPRFSQMSEDDLNATGVFCVLVKPK